MIYDATKLANWEISLAAEEKMPSPYEWADRLGLAVVQKFPMGRLARLDYQKIMDRVEEKPNGKYVNVTAITPTRLRRGKNSPQPSA